MSDYYKFDRHVQRDQSITYKNELCVRGRTNLIGGEWELEWGIHQGSAPFITEGKPFVCSGFLNSKSHAIFFIVLRLMKEIE